MQVFLLIVAVSLQLDGSGRPVLTKGKRPKLHFVTWTLIIDKIRIGKEEDSQRGQC